MNQKGFANIIILILLVVAIAGAGGYFVLNRQVPSPEPTPTPNPIENPSPTPNTIKTPNSAPVLNPTPKSPTDNISTDIQLPSHFEVLGFGKYKNRSSNTPFFIDARILSLPNSTSTQFYELCGSDENSAMSIFTKYITNENRDIILDNPNSTPEQKKLRMADGYGTWYLLDHWKADTHYHYVIATAGESNLRHVILEDCNYFTPTTVYKAQTLGADYSSPIGTFKYSSKTTDSFLAFLKYYYGRQQSNHIFENKLHNVSVKEQADIITISFKIVTVNYGDWGMGTTYTYSTVTHTLDKKTGNMNVTWKTDAQSSGHIDENLLK